MSLDINICQSENCSRIGLSDETGIYSATSNTSGYRTTNLPSIQRVQTNAELTLNGDYFFVRTPQTTYHVWYDVGNVGTPDPAPANSTGIEVTGVTALMSATNVAAQTVISINAFTAWVSGDRGFTSTSVADRIDITNVQTGGVLAASDGTAPANTGFTFSVVQAGTWTGVGIGDVTSAYVHYELPGVTYTHKTFEGLATVVNITTDRITLTGHGFLVRDQVVLESENNPSTLPGGLVEDRIYYIIAVDTNTFSLASSAANATAGTAINLTSVGSDTITIHNNVINVYSILPNITDTQFTIDTSDVDGGVKGTKFSDGTLILKYVISGNGGGTAFTEIVYREFLLYCQNRCCVSDMISDIPEKDCNCNDLITDRALFAFTMLQALKYAANIGNSSRAKSINTTLANLCKSNECAGCGKKR